MVTAAVAKKHRDENARAAYLESLGRAPVYAGNPIPPITAESVFGPTPSLPPTSVNDSMDIDNNNIASTPVKLSPPPPITTPVDHLLPQYRHQIPENDFPSDANLNDHLPPPELYNEGLEKSALEEELDALANIRYG
jgi:hypothetical protein